MPDGNVSYNLKTFQGWPLFYCWCTTLALFGTNFSTPNWFLSFTLFLDISQCLFIEWFGFPFSTVHLSVHRSICQLRTLTVGKNFSSFIRFKLFRSGDCLSAIYSHHTHTVRISTERFQSILEFCWIRIQNEGTLKCNRPCSQWQWYFYVKPRPQNSFLSNS